MRKIIILLLTWGVLLGFFLGYENYFVSGQREYLIDQEFRNLGRISVQLTAEFDRARLSMSSLAKILPAKEKPQGVGVNLDCRDTRDAAKCFAAYSDTYFDGVWDRKIPAAPFLACLGMYPENARLVQEENPSELVVFVQCPSNEMPGNKAVAKSGDTGSFLRLDMRPWVQRAFRDYDNFFDDILIADESGRVLFQLSEGGPRIANLRPTLASGIDISTKQNVFGFLNKGSTDSSAAKAADSDSSGVSDRAADGSHTTTKTTNSPTGKLERLSHGSSATRVGIGGKDYLLFAQPAPVALGNDSKEGNHWRLVLVGLRLSAKLNAESHALPYSVLIWLTLCAAVLLGFSWPWFKLQYMSNTERFRHRDGWLLVLTLLLVAAGVTLMLLNASYLQHSTESTDHALQRLAQQIKTNFDAEISDAFRQLQKVRGTEQFREIPKNATEPGLSGDYLIEKHAEQAYPYFEIVFWSDCDGNQLAKLDVRKVATPGINLNQFAFFRVIKSELQWVESEDGHKHEGCLPVPADQDSYRYAFFEPILSPNTNEFAPILAAPFSPETNPKVPSESKGAGKIVIQALVFRPMSVIDPVLPPGYAFAVIDDKCQVLFHSDSFRDLRENFCEESKDRTELYPWLVSGVDAPLDISYGGRKERAYLTNFPLPGLSAKQGTCLIVFQEGDQQLTLNLAVILVCSIFLGAYFLLLGLVATGHLISRGPLHWDYAPRIIWPCQEFATQYLEVFFLSMILCLLYSGIYHHLHEAPLIGLTLSVAVLSVLFAVIRLTFSRRIMFWSGIAISLAALFAWLLIAWERHQFGPAISNQAADGLAEWRKLPYLPLAVGLFAVVISRQLNPLLARLKLNPNFSERWRRQLTCHPNFLYTLAVVSLIACVSVVPCVGVFKYAYDAVSELSLKHGEAVLAERLLTRKNRIARYYEPLNAHMIANNRLDRVWDRYDKVVQYIDGQTKQAFFDTSCEPNIDEHLNDNLCRSDDKNDRTELGLNDWIEKKIAWATLRFPSNELGSEISRLGVAETDKSKSWERYWQEPKANKFVLRWKAESRAAGLTIVSQYPEWSGLENWARFVGLLFLAAFAVWLGGLVEKIFLTTAEAEPNLEFVEWRKVSDIKRDSLVIGLPRSGKSAQLKKLTGLDPRDFRDLRDIQNGSKLCELEDTDCRSGVIVIDQADFNMWDPAWNQKRIEIAEKLLKKTDYMLVLVSTVDPMYFLTEECQRVFSVGKDGEMPQRLLERWARALDKFVRVKLPNLVEDEFAGAAGDFLEKGPPFAQFGKWICQECSYTPMLQKIGVEILEKHRSLLKQANPQLPTQEQLVKMVAERADAYYRMLWAGLTSSERLVLYQLALDGWANPKNASAIRQLAQKQLIYKKPMYRIMNDSFRSFIRSSEHEKEIAQWQKQEQQSTWQILRFVIIAATIGTCMWLLYAQAQLFQIGTGYITAIATLFTAIAGFTAKVKRSTSSAPADTAQRS